MFAIDRTGNDRGQISEAQVKGMIEILQYFALVLIAKAGCIFLLRVTSEALEFFLECLLVRKLRLLPEQKLGR